MDIPIIGFELTINRWVVGKMGTWITDLILIEAKSMGYLLISDVFLK